MSRKQIEKFYALINKRTLNLKILDKPRIRISKL
jgi:hypothetical protein